MTTASLSASLTPGAIASERELHALEARIGARVADALSTQAEQVPTDIAERLRFGRTQALERARMARLVSQRASATGAVTVGNDRRGAATRAGLVPMWQRMAGLFPLVLLVAGLVAIDRWSAREQIVAVAEIDAQLLADQLPPAAYGDPGFVAYLRSTPLP